MREIKFRVWNTISKIMKPFSEIKRCGVFAIADGLNSDDFIILPLKNSILNEYTGLKDKNGTGLTEVYEGDIISEDGILKGNIYENDKRETDIVVPQLGTKDWATAYKEIVVRGYDYSE